MGPARFHCATLLLTYLYLFPPRCFSLAPSCGFSLAPPRGFSLAPSRGFSLAPPRGFSLAPPRGFALFPPVGFSLAPSRGFSLALPRGFSLAPPLSGLFSGSAMYHLGSVALGSLIIAIVRMVRVFLEYVSNRVRRAQSKIALFLIRCLICCVWCLEHILKFINKNAYIMVAMFGQNFCRSSKEAFLLIMRNLLQTGVVDKVVDFIVIISKLLITGLAGVAAYYWFDRKMFVLESEILDLEFSLLPVIVLTVGAFLVTTIFFSILDQAVDTLFICFLEDLERNDGSPEKPYFMNQNLLRVLGKKNEAPQVESTPEVPPQKAQEHRASQVLSQPQYQSQF
ncbi:hypothetical protein ACOMHN_005014 [Nucella lapillus]